MKHLTFSLHGIDIVMERLELICIFLVILSWTSVDAETHFGFAEKMYNITEGESVKVCVRVIVSDEEIGNEKFNLKVVVQNDNQEYILPGANLATPDTYDPFGFDNMDPLADYSPPRGQIIITAQNRVVCYEQVTYDDSRKEGDEYFIIMLINQSATVIVEPLFSSALIRIIDNDVAVEGVQVSQVNMTAVYVSWDVPEFSHGINIAITSYYTVVYSPIVFNEQLDYTHTERAIQSFTTFCVINSLTAASSYQFQVFVTHQHMGHVLRRARSVPFYFTFTSTDNIFSTTIVSEIAPSNVLSIGAKRTSNDDKIISIGAKMTSVGTKMASVGGKVTSVGCIASVVVIIILIIIIVILITIIIITVFRKHQKVVPKGARSSSVDNKDIHLTPKNLRDPPLCEVSERHHDPDQYKPTIVFFPEEDKQVTEGEEVVFRVKVIGVPEPQVTWYCDGKEIVSNFSMELTVEGSLTIVSAKPKHSGVYRFVAINSVGKVEKDVRLNVKEKKESACTSKKDPISVDEFDDYVTKCHYKDNEYFHLQFTEIDQDGGHHTTIGFSHNLRKLNRFRNITVYDENRIFLRPIEGYPECQRDFINASYIDGYQLKHMFIATQGPMLKTVVDFWRMVWQERCQMIVMVTNLKEGSKTKCHQYWPETGTQSFGPFKVTITNQQILASCIIRCLSVQFTGCSKYLPVTQFHFTAWPDHSVPECAAPLLAFHRKLKQHHKPSKGPILIHCSAGVGRTGTLITIDRTLDQIEEEGVVDIAGTIIHLRSQRMKMVQNVEQYIFIHDAILEAITCGDTQIDASILKQRIHEMKSRDPVTNLTGFENLFKVLEKVTPDPKEKVALENPTRSQNEGNFPGDNSHVTLRGNVQDYVNAVYVNGYQQRHAYIIAQSPSDSTVTNFWKMIYERNCGVIVMLCSLTENGEDVCHQYWPSSGQIVVGEYVIEYLEEERREDVLIQNFSITYNKTGKVHPISQLNITNWSPDGHCSNLGSVTVVLTEMSKIQRRTGNNAVLVHCSDMVSRSAMFCAIVTTIEKCKAEGVVDVFQVAKALRVQKPGAVPTVAQFKTLFEAVQVYLDSFETYCNFRDL